ncbi:MAG: 50S ribosomal protein L22 [Candidatus Nomurabacteria bacterium GW2011_GWB1_37_5]|uniref:Large ribosomal subunit protein uL22 n=1 Tax=Candidatus Nomurabacteria bacterium GW2011_GWB1_37_5 TaxID=1618742 RepID=A0A0G0K106_9BACT|nr:MAG: 50S ribosomal protein L22 [Candidatus Nomurabacteria bacterium GW2011_GWB1_37_5]
MKAYLKNYRQAPRKVRLVANLIKGKGVLNAAQELDFLPKRAGVPIKVLLDSAVANAKQNFGSKQEDLIIKDIRVEKGIVMKRWMPRAFGMAKRINKRNSHITIVLGEKKTDEVNKLSKKSKLSKPSKKISK